MREARREMTWGSAMTGPEVLDVARDAIVTLVLVAAPLMLVGLIVGVAVSLLQALTQIQETTLVFVPKILAIFLALLITLPFMADVLHANFLRIAAHITNG
jgi:flagellar biosynthesis protein FliQ